MGKYLVNIETGERFCRLCKRYDCICLPDGYTAVEYKRMVYNTGKATKYSLKRQSLPNGRKIPTNTDLWIPNTLLGGDDDVFKTVLIDNGFLNKACF